MADHDTHDHTGVPGVGGSLTTDSVILTGADVSLTQNVYTDIISLSLGAGTWFIWGHCNLETDSGAQDVNLRIFDSTNTVNIASGAISLPATGYDGQVTIFGERVLSGTATIKLQGTHSGAGGAKAFKATQVNAAGDTATQMFAIQVA